MEINSTKESSVQQFLPVEKWPPNSALRMQLIPANVEVRGLRIECTQKGVVVGSCRGILVI